MKTIKFIIQDSEYLIRLWISYVIKSKRKDCHIVKKIENQLNLKYTNLSIWNLMHTCCNMNFRKYW